MTPRERSGVAIAVVGFATLSIGDAVVKTMADDWPAFAVAALRFTLGALVLSALLWRSEGAGAFVPQSWKLQAARGVSLAMASVCFFSAIYIMPLAEAMAIGFLAPILTQLFAGLFLGEKVRGKVYLISLIALAGVVIILRPNLALLGWAAMLPFVSAVFFASLMVLNRLSAGQGSALSAQVFVALFCAPVLIIGSTAAQLSGVPELSFGWPSWDVAVRCAIVTVTASTAHWLVYVGTSRAGASQVAPAIYVQMLMVIVLGWAIFGDVPDHFTLLGAGMIIASGLYLWRDSLKPVEEAVGEPRKA